MPMPLSSTVMTVVSSPVVAWMRTYPSRRLYFTAFSAKLYRIWYTSPSVAATAAPGPQEAYTATSFSWATGRSIRVTRSSTGSTATSAGGSMAPLSSRVSRSRSSVMWLSRSASWPMSLTNSLAVALSMFSVWRMESVSSRMEASGVFSSWEASETNCRRALSVSCSRSTRSLNSPAIWVNSSWPLSRARWL